MLFSEIRAGLAAPFNVDDVQFKPQVTTKDKKKAMAVAYLSSRDYEDRLDEVCPDDWNVEFMPWGPKQVICRLTICGVTRSSTGECSDTDPNSATIAEAQAFKRACSKFGLGRYLYSLEKIWVETNERGQFTDAALRQLRKAIGGKGDAPKRQDPSDTGSASTPPADKKSEAPKPPVQQWPRPEEDKLTPEQIEEMKKLKKELNVTDNGGLDFYVEMWCADAKDQIAKRFAPGAPLWLLITKASFPSFVTEIKKRMSAPTEDM